MTDCIFCKIIQGEIPCKKAYEDDLAIAIYDISPVAPVHILVLPKKHISDMNEVAEEDLILFGHLQNVVRKLAQQMKLDKGYRMVVNCGEQGGQTVDHLHFHLLGGRSMQWPPG